MIAALRSAIPTAEIEVHCRLEQRDVFATSRHVGGVREIGSGAMARDDAWIIDSSATWRTIHLRWRSGVGRQIGFQNHGFGWLPPSAAQSESVSPVMNHPVYRKLELLCPLGIHARKVDYGMRPCLAAETWGWRYHLALRSRFARPAALAPSSTASATVASVQTKNPSAAASIILDQAPIFFEILDQPDVSASRWSELITSIATRSGSPAILMGHPRDRVAEVYDRCERFAVAVPELDLEHLRAVVNGCRVVLGDGLATQLAVAGGRPSIALAGRQAGSTGRGLFPWLSGKQTMHRTIRSLPEGTQATVQWTGRPVMEVSDEIVEHLRAAERLSAAQVRSAA